MRRFVILTTSVVLGFSLALAACGKKKEPAEPTPPPADPAMMPDAAADPGAAPTTP